SYGVKNTVVWCALLERFYFFLGIVHVISTGPISTVQTEVRGFVSSKSRKKTPATSFN
ncbi:unnamed protein product, partial [Staurois parvus]